MASNKHPTGGAFGKKGMSVIVSPKGSSPKALESAMESAIRILKKRMLTEGVTRDLRRHECYESPSEAKVRIKREQKKRWQKRLRQLTDEQNGVPQTPTVKKTFSK